HEQRLHAVGLIEVPQQRCDRLDRGARRVGAGECEGGLAAAVVAHAMLLASVVVVSAVSRTCAAANAARSMSPIDWAGPAAAMKRSGRTTSADVGRTSNQRLRRPSAS